MTAKLTRKGLTFICSNRASLLLGPISCKNVDLASGTQLRQMRRVRRTVMFTVLAADALIFYSCPQCKDPLNKAFLAPFFNAWKLLKC